MELEWAALQELGIGIAALVIFYLLIKLVVTVAVKPGIEALNRNSEAMAQNSKAYESLAAALEQSNENNARIQEKLLDYVEDTNRKVTEIHRKVV